MWTWDQRAGILSRNGTNISKGYSGLDYGKNNPDKQNVPGIGPIPQGEWSMIGCGDNPHTGPCSIVLSPNAGTNTYGRSAFLIHGDSLSNPGEASHGCIILPRIIREEIWASNDHTLNVIE